VKSIGLGVRVVVAAAAAGFGFALGQAALEDPGLPPAWAQEGAVTTDEQGVVQAVRRATPAVVSVTHARGSGSGVIIREDGVILTNEHVVRGARAVRVGLADGRDFEAQVLGADPSIDIAILRVAARGLPAAPLGDSDRLEPGQSAIAIGNPLGLERSVTRGVVSAVNRSPRGLGMDEMVQTDAAINVGNSGGPLLDSQGRVIGINTVIIRGDPRAPYAGQAVGLGFAVPINLAADVANQLLTTGVIRRAFLGINHQSLEPALARRAGLPVEVGVIVLAVDPRSPAGRAGMRRADIIVAIDGRAITESGDLRRFMRAAAPGQTVTVRVQRPTGPEEIRVRLGEITI
jgi:S1-C subfamily serine protease